MQTEDKLFESKENSLIGEKCKKVFDLLEALFDANQNSEPLHILKNTPFSSDPSNQSYLTEKILNVDNPNVENLAHRIADIVSGPQDEALSVFTELLQQIRKKHIYSSVRMSDFLLEVTNFATEQDHNSFINLMYALRQNRIVTVLPGAVINELHKRFHKYPDAVQYAVDTVNFESPVSIHESGEKLEYLRRVIESKSASGIDNNYTRSVFETMHIFKVALREKTKDRYNNYFLIARTNEIIGHISSNIEEQLTSPSIKGLMSKPSLLANDIAIINKFGVPYFTYDADMAFSLQKEIEELEGPCYRDDSKAACKELFALKDQLENLFSDKLIDLVEFEKFNISDQEIKDYSWLVSDYMRNFIEQDFGFSLFSLTVNEQFHFLKYLSNTSVVKADTMKAFIKNYGINAMRSFLALAQTEDISGDQIVAFGISVEPEIAEKVFTGYCDLLDQLSDIDTFLNEEFSGDKETKEQLAVLAKEKLQKHAADFLVSQLQRTDVISATESAEIVIEVEKVAGLASAISAALRARKVTSVDTFQSFRQDIVNGKDILSSPLFGEMLEIYRRNYTDKYDYTEAGRQTLLDSFTKKLQKETTQVYVWRIGDNDVLTFLYADEYSDQKMVYIGGLNSNPTFNDTKAGKGLIEHMLRDYDTKQFVITAEAAPQNAAAYMTLYDFVGYKRTDDADEPFVLAVARLSDWDFKSKKTPRNEVLKQLETTDIYDSPDATIVYVKGESNSSIVDSFLDKGYVVTKLFAGNKSDDTATNYFVLEYAPFVYTSLSPTDSEIKSAA